MTDGRPSMARALVRGACPDVAVPMEALDGPLVRVTIPGGIISSGQARVLAEVADCFGNGIIEITNRANLQVRGVTDQRMAAERLVAAGLASGTPGGDRARAILASPTAGVDAQERYDTRPIVRRLVAELAARVEKGCLGGGAAGMGPKFSVLVDAGGAVHVRDRRATERLVPEGLGTDPCPPPIGVVAARQVGQVWVGAAPVLGRINPEVLFGLADLTVRFGDGDVRLTPWKSVMLAGVDRSRAGDLVGELARLELTVEGSDPVLRVVACAGSTGCAQGLADTQAMARALISAARAGDVQPPAAPGIHFSGCEKCCASRDPAFVTWIATNDGMVMRERTALGDGVAEAAGRGDGVAEAAGRGD